MLRSAETFGLKRGTLSPVAGRDRYTDDFWSKADRHDDVDNSALRYKVAFDDMHRAAMALPGVARLHNRCCADHARLIAEKAGRQAEDDPRYQDFIARAGN